MTVDSILEIFVRLGGGPNNSYSTTLSTYANFGRKYYSLNLESYIQYERCCYELFTILWALYEGQYRSRVTQFRRIASSKPNTRVIARQHS